MFKVRKIIVVLMTLAILCGLCGMVFATTNAIEEDTTTPSAVNPFEYAKAPDGLYVFIYYGSSPYMSVDIDTSECVVGRLYVYNSTTASVTEISEQSVTAYTYTINALYYVTTEQKIYKTDYFGTNHEHLYQCTQGTIRNLKTYLDTLYFIEDQTSIILLDVASKTTQEIWAYENLSWVIMLNTDQLIATTAEEDDYLYDMSTDTATPISDIEATNLVTAAVKGTASNNARTTTTVNLATMVTQENDVSFPIEPYGAIPDDTYSKVNGYYYSPPTSWFHTDPTHEGCGTGICKTYGGSSECEGFARYAHDRYAHMENYADMSRYAWDDDKCIITYDYPRLTKEEYGDEVSSRNLKLFLDQYDVKDFFAPLETGAYVRYGKYKDNDREDGVHSIVLVAKDDLGIWVYECNQSYDSNSNHGCGVFLQYYTYAVLTKYEYILHYVNHDFEETPVYDGTTYHKVGCTDCAGYVRKEHDDVSKTFFNIINHRTTFNCCSGSTVTTAHTATVMYSVYSATQHKISAACCSGYLLENHTFALNSNNRYVCTGCGQARDSIIMSLEQKPVSM